MTGTEITDAERRDRLRLARSENVGPVAYRHLMGRFGRASAALDALPHLAQRGGRAWNLRIVTQAEAEAELEAGARLGARLITFGEAAYPPLLAAVDPPPPLLWARGRAELLTRPAVAIVGARIASAPPSSSCAGVKGRCAIVRAEISAEYAKSAPRLVLRAFRGTGIKSAPRSRVTPMSRRLRGSETRESGRANLGPRVFRLDQIHCGATAPCGSPK